MEERKLYLDETLNLDDLAVELEISRHELSSLLNNHIERNFNSFVNQYRIEWAIAPFTALLIVALTPGMLHSGLAIGPAAGRQRTERPRSLDRHYQDANYGFLIQFWDLVFRTFRRPNETNVLQPKDIEGLPPLGGFVAELLYPLRAYGDSIRSQNARRRRRSAQSA